MPTKKTDKDWRACAREARDVAEAMADASAKREMLQIAEGYERLAEHTERTRRKEAS
jgi:hypothetical protein